MTVTLVPPSAGPEIGWTASTTGDGASATLWYPPAAMIDACARVAGAHVAPERQVAAVPGHGHTRARLARRPGRTQVGRVARRAIGDGHGHAVARSVALPDRAGAVEPTAVEAVTGAAALSAGVTLCAGLAVVAGAAFVCRERLAALAWDAGLGGTRAAVIAHHGRAFAARVGARVGAGARLTVVARSARDRLVGAVRRVGIA